MDKEKIRETLAIIGDNQRRAPELKAEWVQNARDAGMTWREIAIALGLTEHGVIKTHNAWLARQPK